MNDESRPNPRNEKPISLAPLTVEEALRKAMQADPEKVREAEKAEKAERQKQRKSKRSK